MAENTVHSVADDDDPQAIDDPAHHPSLSPFDCEDLQLAAAIEVRTAIEHATLSACRTPLCEADRDDIAQATLAVLAKKWPSECWPEHRAEITSYGVRTAQKKVAQLFRESKRRQRLLRNWYVRAQPSTTQQSPASEIEQSEQLTQLRALLASSETRVARVIRLRTFENRSFREIGKRMGLGEDGARKLYGRAIVDLGCRARQLA